MSEKVYDKTYSGGNEAQTKKFLDYEGVKYLWSKINMQDYPNNQTLINVINAIDETKADKAELNQYLRKEDYVAGETGSTVIANMLMEMMYPIGSIYISTISLDPGIQFSFGVWEKIEGKFLLGASAQFPAGSEGGEVEHTLTELEMPAHDHEFDRHQLWRNEIVPPSTSTQGDGYGANNKTLPIYTDTTIATGAGDPHNNMPPYLSVYIWKRVE